MHLETGARGEAAVLAVDAGEWTHARVGQGVHLDGRKITRLQTKFRYTFVIYMSGIFLENNFMYQNAHNNELGGAISANYRGFFSISCLLFDI